jgi:hypothetical protein
MRGSGYKWIALVLVALAAGCQTARPLVTGDDDAGPPARGYLLAHRGVEQPDELLGGAVFVRVTQRTGGALLALPDHRMLDKTLFGSPGAPRFIAGTPIVTGVPRSLRRIEEGRYTMLDTPSPFGAKHMVVAGGRLLLEAYDITATDATVSEDSVRLEAAWRDHAGNEYSVRCARVMPYGVEHPVFGGVATNHILNGFSGIGTPLIPSGFAYVAFWGIGETTKNGQVTDTAVMIQGMLTEGLHDENNELVFDQRVRPGHRQFHLLVPSYVPDGDRYRSRPVRTGFMLDDGTELAFWRVAFSNVMVHAYRISSSWLREQRSGG